MAKTILDAINRAEAGIGPVISVPDGEITLADISSAQTLTNKTLTSPVLNSPVVNDGRKDYLDSRSVRGVLDYRSWCDGRPVGRREQEPRSSGITWQTKAHISPRRD